MSLMIAARCRSAWHIATHLREWRKHRIWRVYRYFGLDTQWVGCECGADFGCAPHASRAREGFKRALQLRKELMR